MHQGPAPRASSRRKEAGNGPTDVWLVSLLAFATAPAGLTSERVLTDGASPLPRWG